MIDSASASAMPPGARSATPAMPFLPRTGIGIDVHAFASPQTAEPLRLACLTWPGEPGLEGHSDGDVVAHVDTEESGEFFTVVLGERTHQSLQQDSSKFMEAIAPLEGEWKGSSVGSWQEMTQAWTESMNGVNSALGELTTRVEGAGQAYQTGEDEQTQALKNRFAGMDMPQGNMI